LGTPGVVICPYTTPLWRSNKHLMVNDGTPCRVDLFISFDLNHTIKIIKKKIICSFKALCDLYDTFNLQF